MRTITVIIERGGNMKAEAEGFTGGECNTAVDQLLEGLVGERRTEQTAEFYVQPQPKVKIKPEGT